jgi:hypothetical protein
MKRSSWMPLECKRRKLPPSFRGLRCASSERQRRAAIQLQRFWRWTRAVRGRVDPILQEPVRIKEAVRLVEVGNVEHWYNASSLASYFLSTACFNNPLSRRELWCWEVLKIANKVSSGLRPVLLATYVAREALQKEAYEAQGSGLDAAFEESADDRLQAILGSAEALFFNFNLNSILEELDEYERDLAHLNLISQKKASDLCLRHRDVVAKRGFICPPNLARELGIIYTRILKKNKRGGEQQPPRTEGPCILRDVLLRRLEFL